MVNYSQQGPAGPHSVPPVKNLVRRIRGNANCVCLGLLLMFFLNYWVFPFWWSWMQSVLPYRVSENPASLYTVQLVSYLFAFGLPALLMVQLIGIPARVALPSRPIRISLLVPAVMLCLGTSIVGGMLSNLVGLLVRLTTGLTTTMPDFSPPEGALPMLLYVVSLTVAPAFLEEIMFRGVIMQSLRRFGDSFALWVSAILFGFAHGNLVQGPNAVLLGFVIGYFVMRTGSLWTGVIIHFINNSVALALQVASEYFTERQFLAFNGIVFILYILMGIVGLIWLFTGHWGMFHIHPSHYPLGEGRKFFSFFTSLAAILYVLATAAITSLYLQ